MTDKKKIEIYNKMTQMYTNLIAEIYNDFDDQIKKNEFNYANMKVVPSSYLRQLLRTRRAAVLEEVKKLRIGEDET